jgi:hypothetical protein
MRDGKFHTVLGGVSSSLTSGSYSSEVLMRLLEVTKIVSDNDIRSPQSNCLVGAIMISSSNIALY